MVVLTSRLNTWEKDRQRCHDVEAEILNAISEIWSWGFLETNDLLLTIHAYMKESQMSYMRS